MHASFLVVGAGLAGLTAAEQIAARLGISESLCRMRLTRARRRCRELWEAQGGPDGSGAKIF